MIISDIRTHLLSVPFTDPPQTGLLTLGEIDLQVGEEASPLGVSGLEGRLGQVLRNLISNAITVSPKGGTIRAENRYDRDGAVIGACFVIELPLE